MAAFWREQLASNVGDEVEEEEAEQEEGDIGQPAGVSALQSLAQMIE